MQGHYPLSVNIFLRNEGMILSLPSPPDCDGMCKWHAQIPCLMHTEIVLVENTDTRLPDTLEHQRWSFQ